MTSRSSAELWQALVDAGLVQGDLPASSEAPAPWFVRAMLGVAGWIGALFLLGFVGAGLAFVFRDEGASLIAGALCCAAAFAIFAKGGRNVLASQFGLAVSLAGQAMFIYGLYGAGRFNGLPASFLLTVAAFEAALAVMLDSFVHRVWSSFAAAFAFAYAMNALGLYGAGAAASLTAFALVWLHEDRWAVRGAFWRAMGWGIAFVAVQPSWLFGDAGRLFGPADPMLVAAQWVFWLKALVIAGVLIYVAYRLIERYGVAPSNKAGAAALAAAAIVSAATYRAPGITSALVIVLLGFAGGNRSLFGFGILALLTYLAWFYYSLQTTLLLKSYALAGTGVILIGLWLLMRFQFGSSTERKEPSRA